MIPSIVQNGGAATFYYNPDSNKTCIDIEIYASHMYFVAQGFYSVAKGFAYNELQKAKSVYTCQNFIPSSY